MTIPKYKPKTDEEHARYMKESAIGQLEAIIEGLRSGKFECDNMNLVFEIVDTHKALEGKVEFDALTKRATLNAEFTVNPDGK